MASIFRKEPTTTPTSERPKPRPVAVESKAKDSVIGRLRRNIDDIVAELRKVTWPSREETRNHTIGVIGISAAIGIFLSVIDVVLSAVYQFLNGLF
jgi:preprotein translocase subunit SecE